MSVPDEPTGGWTPVEARPLGERFPALRLMADQPVELIGAIADEELPMRVRTMLARGRIKTCGELAQVSEEGLGELPQVGKVVLGEMLRLLRASEERLVAGSQPRLVNAPSETVADREVKERVEAALQLLRDEGNPILSIESDLDLLAQWSSVSGEDGTLGHLIDAVAEQGSLPEDVRAAWHSVRRFEISVEPVSHQHVLARWMDSLPERERDIVMHRIVRTDRTLDALAQGHGHSRERIRQLEVQLRRELEGHCAVEDEWRPVRWAVHRLAALVGAWARLADISVLDPWQDTDRLVMVLAGLEVDDDEKVVRRLGFELPRMNRREYVQPEGELLDLDAARDRLTAVGVLDTHMEHALNQLGLKEIDGTWVRWPSNSVDRSVAILAVVGEPMTADELAERTGSTSVRSLRQRLYEDPRVQRVNKTELGLRTWGLPEYTSVAELMLRVIAESGGSVSVAELATQLEQAYQVRSATVSAYTAAPAFVVESGMIRAREWDEAYEVETDTARVPGLMVLDEDRFSYDVRVDHEMLRGSGRPAPEALAGILGLQPGRSLLFTARDTDHRLSGAVVIVSWSRTSVVGPSFGSLRALANHEGAREGDLLRLTFNCSQMSVHHELLT